ncbi:Uncharacterised protein [Kluyvera cryocrescens]|uniref:Uncharacterized protein n=1 Tax=Kluyvera cryocrescens TaxID=580 RepID=A0A485BXL4_KLUCR|nr:Uncharacterised protein [Kluyvera cryocrescens]
MRMGCACRKFGQVAARSLEQCDINIALCRFQVLAFTAMLLPPFSHGLATFRRSAVGLIADNYVCGGKLIAEVFVVNDLLVQQLAWIHDA